MWHAQSDGSRDAGPGTLRHARAITPGEHTITEAMRGGGAEERRSVVTGQQATSPTASSRTTTPAANRWRFEPVAIVVAQARTAIREACTAWRLDEEDAENIVLAADELVSNAVEHACTQLELAVDRHGRSVHVTVRDHSSPVPEMRLHDPWAARGRGLQMVEALADEWGWIVHADGKTIWATFTTSGCLADSTCLS
jgi:anti-sigma regulatory factor (Ser/Thr protein kinase)